ncbi:hypothetical protein [Nitrosophilus kaiyonis]|nr:hypothetical protein [Nitrosophilus kaiyonis]
MEWIEILTPLAGAMLFLYLLVSAAGENSNCKDLDVYEPFGYDKWRKVER